MREILFRGKCIKRDGWAYGEFHIDDICRATIEIPRNKHTDKSIPRLSLISLETVGQYTGMKDKNGVKIFEGDIVRRHEEPFNLTDVGVVVYNEAIGSFRLHVEKSGTTKRYDFVASDTYNDSFRHVKCKATFEVIGNKFDNPELLEGGK